jgi:hypothetical protein
VSRDLIAGAITPQAAIAKAERISPGFASALRPPIKTSRSPAQTPDEPGFWDLTIEVLLGGLSWCGAEFS